MKIIADEMKGIITHYVWMRANTQSKNMQLRSKGMVTTPEVKNKYKNERRRKKSYDNRTRYIVYSLTKHIPKFTKNNKKRET